MKYQGAASRSRSYENANKRRQVDVDVEETKHDLVSARISYVLYTSFLILDTLYNCYQKGDFPTVVVMKKYTNHSSFSLFWRLSVDINGISVLSILYTYR